MEEKIIKIIEEKIKPSLQADGGDIKFISWNASEGIVGVRMQGACAGCPMMQTTLKEGVEAELKKHIPEIKEVINI